MLAASTAAQVTRLSKGTDAVATKAVEAPSVASWPAPEGHGPSGPAAWPVASWRTASS